MMRIREVLQEAVEKLKAVGKATPLLDAEVLLCHVLHMDRLYLYIHRDREITEEQIKAYGRLIEKRLDGVPVQYLIHRQEFMGLEFYVEEGVLIPRPDTEILVEAVIRWVQAAGGQEPIFIADLGTGSGAISVSLAYYLQHAYIYSVDVSPKALAMGRENAKIHGVEQRIEFLRGDLFEPFQGERFMGTLDVLVSNPPYIPRKEIPCLQPEVAKYEPKLALDGGEDGLDFYRRIVGEAYLFLKNRGLIALEVGHDQADAVKKMMEERKNYTEIQKIRDFGGIERVVTALVDKQDMRV